jgi:nucleoside-diphosphate-sugar epimerase
MENTNNTLVLVTGGTGFVGIHCVLQLLQHGYKVRATLRSIKRKQEVLEMLGNGGITNFDNLSLIETDLTKDDNWTDALKDCTYVLHIASPIYLKLPKHEDDMIRPAVDGALRVLKAARDAGVKRVVMTSNFGAVGYSHKDAGTLITEESWTNPNEKNLTAYLKSKVLAERAAWNFMHTEGGGLELTVINPAGIFGPSLGPDVSSGAELLRRLLNGSMKAVPNIPMGIVDVRDVADLHIRAMTSTRAAGERFLALAGGTMTLSGIAKLLKEKLGDKAAKVSTKILPDWVVRIAALFNPVARQIAPQLGKNKNASNEKAKSVLDWQPRSNETAIITAAESLLVYHPVN